MAVSMRELGNIFVRFFRIGAFTIGGGVVMLGVIESEIRATGKFTDDETADMIVLATTVPGPIATNLSFLAGKSMAGLPGALVAVLGTTLAPFLCILFLAGLIMDYLENPWVLTFFAGAMAGIIVLVGNTLWNMIQNSVLKGAPQAAAFLTTTVLVLVLKVNPFIGLLAGAVVSMAGQRIKNGKAPSAEDSAS